MKRTILIAGLFIFLATPLFAQENAEEVNVKLPDAVMEQVVKRVVTWYFKAPKKSKTIYFAAENLKKEWLPEIKNIDFVILERTAFNERKVYFFRDVEKKDNYFLIPIGYGNPHCESTGDTWSFRVDSSRVKLLQQAWAGWGFGCSASG